jgi:hypothetical protein
MPNSLPSFDEKVATMTEAIAAVLEHPECPRRLAADIIDLFDELRNFYGNYIRLDQTAQEIRRELPGFIEIMRRVEERQRQQFAD